MRAAVVDRYGSPDVVRVAEVPTPTPGSREALVRVTSAAVTSADSRIRGARFPAGFGVPARLIFGVRRPRRAVLGSAFAGVVEAVGGKVEGVAAGDRVCGMTGLRLGAHAEQLVTRADRLVPVPEGVTDDEAAGVLFGGTTALFFLRDKASMEKGCSVLVNGASGAIGTIAVQLAKRAGTVVTGVTSGSNAALVTELGADDVIDHQHEDLAGTTARFDVVLDTVGNLTVESGRRLLAPRGRLLLAVATLGQTLRARGDVGAGTSGERPEDMAHLLELVAAGELRVVVDRVGTLDDVVKLHRRVDSGRKVGNVLLRP